MMSTGLFPQSEVLKELRSKGLTLSRTAFGRMLRNPVYRGRIRIEADGGEPEMVVPGLHAPIVEAAVFERTQRVLQALKSRRKSKSRPTPPELPLRGKLCCPECGGKMTGGRSLSRKRKYFWYYHCQRGCRVRFRAEQVNDCFEEFLVSLNIPDAATELFRAILRDHYEELEGNRRQKYTQLREQHRSAEERLLSLDKKYFDEEIELDSYQRLKSSFVAERDDLAQRLELLEQGDPDQNQYVDFGLRLLSELPTYYSEAPQRVKLQLLDSIFPGRLSFDGSNYRITELNEALAVLLDNKQQLNHNIKVEKTPTIALDERRVGPTGFEPVTSRV